MKDMMQRVMRLMQAGDLRAASSAIQAAIAGNKDAPARAERAGSRDHSSAQSRSAPSSDAIDVEFRVVDGDEVTDAEADVPADRKAYTGAVQTNNAFQEHHFSCEFGELQYKLYIPDRLEPAGAPLLLMLHGCTQTPDDFAIGTRMNTLADTHGYVVAYPAQSSQHNPNRCWNWFRPDDQRRDQGEPALLAALTRRLIHTHHLDERRVYVAGLSAGGAMAAILANTHSDLFAAIGVHSGLPIGLAHDVTSAFAAMRRGRSAKKHKFTPSPRQVPAIVFHGENDSTVHPSNGIGVINQIFGDVDDVDRELEHGTAAGGRSFTRTIYRLDDRSVAAELWDIEGAGHAWSGGDARGTYTDSAGPDASTEMLRFFSNFARAKTS